MNAQDYGVEIVPNPSADGGGFIGRVIDLPGCMSDGATPEEALRNTYEAIADWIDAAEEMGRPVPSPSPLRKTA